MTFSNADVAKFMRENFICAWESVRPVPLVEIDFGNGQKLKRTVNGNVATYICAPDGRVVDIIPGLNSPEAYLKELRWALNLYRAASARGTRFEEVVLDYHKSNLAQTTRIMSAGIAKTGIERFFKVAIGADDEPPVDFRRYSVPTKLRDFGKHVVELPVKRPLSDEETALLAADTALNRKERKPLVHKLLAEKVVKPGEITKRLYKDVLHCDLDDPYLGLVSAAFNGGAYEKPR